MTQEDLLSVASALRAVLDRLSDHPEELAGSRGRKAREELEGLAADLRSRLARLDPTRHPKSFFDPADPRLFGIFAAIALVGVERLPLSCVEADRFYGSGVYALYYQGGFPLYRPIARTEHPLYVGKADPESAGARTPREQGERLCTRLNEHRKNIESAGNLELADFACRYLVVATGWQTAAESSLIGLFRPIWNKETGILLGFGKHGDSAETRRNRRSPWDVLHAGRKWAADGALEDAKSADAITRELGEHFRKHAPVPDMPHIVRELTAQVRAVRAL